MRVLRERKWLRACVWVIIMVMDFQVMSFFEKKIFLRVCVQLMKKQQQQTKNNDIIKIRTLSCERFLRKENRVLLKKKKSLTRYESQRAGECG